VYSIDAHQHANTDIPKVQDFTGVEKKFQERLQFQIKKRLPVPKPSECLAVLLESSTMMFSG
jgi:hypothetical protein